MRALTILRAAQKKGRHITVPAPVVLEWWRGQHGPAATLLSSIGTVEPLTHRLARIAGAGLEAVRGSSAIDAAVMASAAQRGDEVYTSDFDDLEALRGYFRGVPRVHRI